MKIESLLAELKTDADLTTPQKIGILNKAIFEREMLVSGRLFSNVQMGEFSEYMDDLSKIKDLKAELLSEGVA